ncbi:MAG: endolytic transglycosylase MltG [Clostridia bacterium]|nr:endolytic transglycosylase MltG [Clostridia bacterium]
MEKGLNRMKQRYAKRKKQRSRILIIVAAVIAVIVVINAVISQFNNKTVAITIKEGTSSTQIARILKDEGIINSRLWFLLRLSLSEYSGKLQYGTFKIDTNDSIGEIIEILATKGAKKNTVTLTIPEGYSVERIKARVTELGLCTDTEFENALNNDYDYSFLKSVPNDKAINYRLQGFLYPSTYEFYSDASAETVITAMLDEFEKQVSSLGISESSLYEVVTKASMIEREAKIASERPIIAGVIENRLKQNMLLQLDATVVYAISDGMYNVDRVYYKNLETDSKYNTYKYKGLPVGPICCPGIASIKAASNPSRHNYLYYHTDTAKNDGSHIFTETYEEHKSTMN